jgi:GSH-dependent disulfide-bond oxidoreductase
MQEPATAAPGFGSFRPWWFEAMREREAVKRAYARAKEINTAPIVSEESKKILFGQTAAVAQ